MTTQLVRDSMKLMADAGVDIVDIKWFDLSGGFTDQQRADFHRQRKSPSARWSL